MFPTTYTPPVQPPADHGHGDLINQLYQLIQNHPDPAQMASYGNMLAKALADQAKFHASLPRTGGQPQGPGGHVAEDGPGAGVPWDVAATGHPPLSLAAQLALVNPPMSPAAPDPIIGAFRHSVAL